VELEFTSDQEDLRASVRSVLQRECPISLVREVVEKGTVPDALWRRMIQLDWPALTVPEDSGGVGLGMVELAVLSEELGRVLTPAPLLATAALFVPAVREAGTAEQRIRFLSPVAEGKTTGTLAVAEGSASNDLAQIAALARRDGDGWVLAGTKRYVIDGDRADEIAVAARVEGGGLGVFVVPGSAVQAQSVTAMDRSRRLATVVLDGVRVEAERALGQPGACDAAIERAIEEATLALAVEIVGTCSSIFEIALEYAKVREQFGVKIGSFQAMKHKFADMFVALEAARASAYFAAAAIAEDDPRRSLAVSMAKALAGDCERRVAQDGIQSLGGIGFTWEHDMHLYVKRAMASASLFGTAEQHRGRVASLLGLVPGSPLAASQASLA
jgi:alkylation response protein AidB-like acyl-CoA dehydrogenase